jgi:oligopeptide/dipeptide ABC transporter ATP-binding protein
MTIDLLSMCGLPSGTERMYPHELSGGMRQRATIAAALALRPKLIIADEPTTALDVVVQRTILEFFLSFKQRFGSSIIVVTHDISIQSEICDRTMVMYGGKIVEIGPTREIFYKTKHPYTKALIAATPTLSYVKELVGMTGRPPSLIDPPVGCRFASRCPHSKKICLKEEPKLIQVGSSLVACHMFTSNKW